MSKFTRDVIAHSQAIRKSMQELLQKDLIEDDKYIQQIGKIIEKNNASFPSIPENDNQRAIHE